jgi:HAD superfamily hydrolase (TIGR01450 family)
MNLLSTAPEAFAHYESIRPRLPSARFPAGSRHAPDLRATFDAFDGYVLDAYGVLNVGGRAIPGAAARVAQMRAAGKRVCVLTNGASYPRAVAMARYHALGFDFGADEVVSSRDVTGAHLDAIAPGARWAAISEAGDSFADIPADLGDLLNNALLWRDADAFVFLSSARWSPALQDRLVQAITDRPRPVVIANPDLIAPLETRFSIEPGFWAHDLWDRTGHAPIFHGKPYGSAFAAVARKMDMTRTAMVGDTLHTDTLGGAAAGLGTVLVAGHGLFAGHDADSYAQASGIIPDWIVQTT